MSDDICGQYDQIYRYCYFKVKNAALAEDLTQESFLRFFSQSSYIDHGRPMAYLYTIARNLCTDAFRQKQFLPLDESMAADNPLEKTELTLVLRQALSVLPAKEQELLLLRYANQMSVGEIAAFVGMSRFSVYRKTSHALATLKKLLGEEDYL